MSTTITLVDEQVLDLALECVYRFLAGALRDPRTAAAEPSRDFQNREIAVAAMDELRAWAEARQFSWDPPEPGLEFLDLRPLAEALGQTPDVLGEDFDRVFGLLSPKECPPYETEFNRDGDDFQRAQQMADVAGFYEAFGLTPSRARPDRPDHIVLELEFVSLLLTKKRLARVARPDDLAAEEHLEVCDKARRDFVGEHLVGWVPSFSLGLKRKAGAGYIHDLASVLSALIPLERVVLDLPAGLTSSPVRPALRIIEPLEEEAECGACQQDQE